MKNITRLLSNILIIALSTFFQPAKAQAPNIQWQKCIGGSDDDFIQNIIKLHDGNYLSCGATASTDGNFNAKHGSYDAFLMKTDGAGNIIWKKTYGGSGVDLFFNMAEASNGNIYAIGSTTSNDGQVHGNHGGDNYGDVWVAIINSSGKLLSQHCYGGSGDEYALGITLTSDNKVVFAAETNSNDGDVSNNHGDSDGWVVKLKSNGSIKWETTIGDTTYDNMYTIAVVNGNYLVTGTKATLSSLSTDNLPRYYDAHAAFIDHSGNIIWYHIYGGSGSDDCNGSVLTSDGNAVLAGHTSSHDGDVPDNNGFNSWVWKIDVANGGNILWETYFGVVADTAAGFNVFQTSDGGFVVVGAIAPNLEEPISTWDSYIGKVDANGTLLWTKQFGGSDFEAINGGVEELDGSLLLVGETVSNDGDVSGNHGGPEDCWVVNLSDEGEKLSFPENSSSLELKSYPNPFSTSTTISFSLAQSENASLKIFDMEGRLIRVLANDAMSEGTHLLTWDVRDENGNAVTAGIYFLKMQTANESETIRLSVVK